MAQGTTLSWQLNEITKLLSFRGFNFENWQSCIPSSHQCWFISFVVKIVAVLLSYVMSALDTPVLFRRMAKMCKYLSAAPKMNATPNNFLCFFWNHFSFGLKIYFGDL